MTKKIFTVGFELPGEEFEFVRFDSDQSLLDADIVLYKAGFEYHYPESQYQGEPLLGHQSSVRVSECVDHWLSELTTAVNAGKLVIVYVTKPLSYFRYTGLQEFSGTGRSRVTTNLVTRIGSYDAVPRVDSAIAKSGREVRLTADASYLESYWREFGGDSPYEAFITGDFTHTLIETKSASKIVGAAVRGKGPLLFLPPLRFDESAFTTLDEETEEELWNDEALRFGKRLVSELVALQKVLAGAPATPPPTWAMDAAFSTPQESSLSREIADVSMKIDRLQKKRGALQLDLASIFHQALTGMPVKR